MFLGLGMRSYSPQQVSKAKITETSGHVFQNKGIKLSKVFYGYIQKETMYLQTPDDDRSCHSAEI